MLLDFPYCYKMDANKLYCNNEDPDGNICGEAIDYDPGFNNLICPKCNKRYFAINLKEQIAQKLIIVKGEDDINLKVRLKQGDRTLATYDSTRETSTIVRKKK